MTRPTPSGPRRNGGAHDDLTERCHPDGHGNGRDETDRHTSQRDATCGDAAQRHESERDPAQRQRTDRDPAERHQADGYVAEREQASGDVRTPETVQARERRVHHWQPVQLSVRPVLPLFPVDARSTQRAHHTHLPVGNRSLRSSPGPEGPVNGDRPLPLELSQEGPDFGGDQVRGFAVDVVGHVQQLVLTASRLGV